MESIDLIETCGTSKYHAYAYGKAKIFVSEKVKKKRLDLTL